MPADAATPFHDLDAFIALPRVSGLAISPDGTRLVTTVAELKADRTAYATAIWEVDPSGQRVARRLTRSAKGESNPTFTPDGDVLFTSVRPDPEADEDLDDVATLALLPVAGGEARTVATRPGGFDAVVVAPRTGTVVAISPTLPGSGDAQDDRARRAARKELKVNAVLHRTYPVRHWDHDLGPEEGRLVVGDLVAAATTAGTDRRIDLRDLTMAPGRALDEADIAVAPDGSFAVTTWYVPDTGGRRLVLQRVDLVTGERCVLLDSPQREAYGPAISPDGHHVAAVTETVATGATPPRFGLVVIDVATGQVVDLATTVTAPPESPVWTPDGTAVVVTADARGRRPVFRINVADGTTTRLTGDDGAYTDVVVSPDGTKVFAIRSAIDGAPMVVALDATTADQTPTVLRNPVQATSVPGSLTEVETTATDGTALRAWLCLPHDASAEAPSPLLLWIHGGPLGSWNAWSWRWNPWMAVAEGYAVLLPDPALSTGYGDAFIDRGWGAWGAAPYTDLMALTDATVGRPEVDETRTAAMGGSFGGYMANWVAGHTDRFD
ncbi:MAG TPA: prolyl oligopeptidase family serine peptidase, partial [Euzebya sp.]|nr:prolyl oligopeptidase family serine peptidase [Euzebya sp.]